MTKVKGSNICFARAYADGLLATGGFAEVRARLCAEDQACVEAAIPSGWYELSLQHRIFVALDRVVSRAGNDGIERFARFVAEQDLTRIHRLFLRLRNPAVALEKGGEYWQRFYDAGTWEVERLSSSHVRGSLSGIDDPHPVFCRFLSGYTQRMFQLAGARVSPVQHTACVVQGAPACVFEGRWDVGAAEEQRADESPRASLSTPPG